MRGELDWIVMKALEKDRDRRYETANGLARDIERYLHDEPVEACPPTAGYKLRKFARKHKAGLATAAAIRRRAAARDGGQRLAGGAGDAGGSGGPGERATSQPSPSSRGRPEETQSQRAGRATTARTRPSASAMRSVPSMRS